MILILNRSSGIELPEAFIVKSKRAYIVTVVLFAITYSTQSLAVCTMVVAPKLYPRATLKRIVKSHSRRPLSKNADILVSKLHWITSLLVDICQCTLKISQN